jgi:geranylgeranyl diphosphate synthase type II
MSAAAGVADVERALAHYAGIVAEAIDDLLGRQRPAAYLSDLVDDYPRRGGKGIRSALVLAACRAYGGSVREGLGPAVAIELLHNAFLVHDDVEDGSTLRRGRPTLHELHGAPLAVNAGDALAIVALQALGDWSVLGARVSRQIAGELLAMLRQTTEGQALELGWRRDNVIDLTVVDYLTLIAKKTCCYTSVAPLRIGALAGSRGTASLGGLTRFGFYLGAAFQIRDDLLSVVGVEEMHGKDALDDIREGKRTLMLLHVLAAASAAERAWVVAYLASPEAARSPDDVERVRDLMQRHGSVAFAQEIAAGIELAATAALDAAFAEVPDSPHVAFVRGLVPYMLARSL